MDREIQLFLLLVLFQFWVVAAVTNTYDVAVLKSLKNQWQNVPPSWEGSDPCQDGWEGIGCSNSRVITIELSSMGLKGQLSGDFESLSELLTLDLSYNKGLTGPLPPSIGGLKKLSNLILVGCSFSGPIPETIGSLQKLVFLSLNSNSFSGSIPPSIGKLSNLYWLDLADNKLTGSIPVSDGDTPGLDLLTQTRHFHFGKNQLSGTIPPQLFSSDMTLIHVLFEGNQLTGSIPSTLGFVTSLEVLRLDRNSLNGAIPSNLNNLKSISEMYLSNNYLTGSVPNLTGMNLLNYVDLSNNSFDASNSPPWFSTLQSLTTLVMENTKLQGELPQTLFTLPQLQTLILRNNKLNGTLDIGNNFSDQLRLVDLQNNFISGVVDTGYYPYQIILLGNKVCPESATARYCKLPEQSTPSYSTGTNNCVPILCPVDQKASPNCICAYPYMGTLFFRAISFSDLRNSSNYVPLERKLMETFQTNQLPVDSVFLSNPTMDEDNYLEVGLAVFPSGKERFNRSDVSSIGFILSNQTFKPPKPLFGPFFFIGLDYGNFAEPSGGSKKSVRLGIIIGPAMGGFLLLLVLIGAGVYAFRHKRTVKTVTEQSNPFASWNPSKSSGSMPQLKGPRLFSFDELRKGTNNFSEANDIGSGGILANGQLVAIKRSQEGSMQGGLEFKTEIELLSRVHHKNLVSLVGFCFEEDEQMLVYEFIPNGTLKESLSGKSGIRLDWKRRLRVALGSARGLAYLHEFANPPIIHRDIKTNNILLDESLNAKVADFGLSKPMGSKGHLTTQVKGTMGYVDPEYYMTQQLTEKSDVYSFGVVLLEILTARVPLERGRYIVREVRVKMDTGKDLYGLHELLDPTIGLGTTLGGFGKFVDLAMRCVNESGEDRPAMSEVVKEIENIMQLAGLNPNAESASTSASYEGTSRNSRHPYNNEASFDYSGPYTPSRVEPK
ncbi:Protein kinase domain [Macleaya cordata]|uniref:non-specific serine/threonine protein kinase n=1 Tax=Macleaya cordata TaxID=56857 RepID=A0A200R8V3_MACCD|nr:Protein kinase domain [Macleaya cordata]